MDIYDRAEWTEMDIDDLKAELAAGCSIEEAAAFLCRADSAEEVRQNAGSWAGSGGTGLECQSQQSNRA